MLKEKDPATRKAICTRTYFDKASPAHAHPELSYQEFETSKFVQQRLTETGIPFTVMAATRCGGIDPWKESRPSNSLRFARDMDALPIREENDVPYKSKNAQE